MPFPKTQDEMRSAGYIFENDAVCRGCGEDIEWYTTPTGKKIPMNPMDKGTAEAVPHWATCPDHSSFRR